MFNLSVVTCLLILDFDNSNMFKNKLKQETQKTLKGVKKHLFEDSTGKQVHC